jgi:serine phosphatase RsbU (regulator of sigma subunit)
VLYTDGIIEARNAGGEFYERDRLAAVVAGAREQPVDKICAAVITSTLAWASVQADDVTLLIARFTGG